MKLYDNIIRQWLDTSLHNAKHYTPDDAPHWREGSERVMILRSDMAYELGGGGLPAIGCTVVTADATLVPEDRISVIGPELPEITGDAPYARIALVRVKAGGPEEGDRLFNAIRKLEYTRYHFYPEGFMLRVSAMDRREAVRVSGRALKEGLSFAGAGALLIDAFHRQETVEAVEIFFITDPSFDYACLKKQAEAAENITKTIDHIFKDVKMDCHVCSLQKICEEVEGLRELHFAKAEQ